MLLKLNNISLDFFFFLEVKQIGSRSSSLTGIFAKLDAFRLHMDLTLEIM